jgi:hypothetical protein
MTDDPVDMALGRCEEIKKKEKVALNEASSGICC